MPTIIMILNVPKESHAWEIYEYFHKFHNILKAENKRGGDLGMDVEDKGIYSLERSNGQYHLICKRE